MRGRFFRRLLLCGLAILLLTVAAGAKELEYGEVTVTLLQEGAFPSEAVPAVVLMDEDETIYDAVYEGMRKCMTSIDVKRFNITGTIEEIRTQVEAIYSQVVNSHPELFYVESGCGFSVLNGELMYIRPGYDEVLLAEKDQVQAKADWILSVALGEDMTDLEKALALHDYLVLNCAYDWNVANGNASAASTNVYSIYGVLMEGNAVCQGYALAYQYLLSRVGIQAGVIIASSMNHAWNWVEIDGERYHVDVTWDDPVFPSSDGTCRADVPGFCRHDYFLLDSDTITDDEHGHYGFDPDIYDFEDVTYLSDYAFCGAEAPFIWNDGGFYAVNNYIQVVKIEDLHQNAFIADDILVAVHDDTIYFYNNFLYGSGLFRFDMQADTLTRFDGSGKGYLFQYGVSWDDETESICLVSGVAGQMEPSVVLTYQMSDALSSRSLSVGTPLCTENLVNTRPAIPLDGSFVLALTNNRASEIQVQLWCSFYRADGKQLGIRSAGTITLEPNAKELWTQDMTALNIPSGTSYMKLFWLDPSMQTPLTAATVLAS